MSTAIALPKSTNVADWTEEEKAVIDAAGLVFKHAYGDRKGAVELAPRAVITKFMHTCARTGLDPLARQIYCIGRLAGGGVVEWSIQTAIDGFRVIAERSKKYAGQDGSEWLTSAGEWVSVFVKALHGDHPLAARVSVYRHDWKEDKPAIGIATWDEYAQTKRDGSLTAMWQQRGPGQLAKCAEALAMRKAFPQDLSGLYTDDEMQDRAEPIEAEPSGFDWDALIESVATREELFEVATKLKESGEGTDALRAKFAARLGMLDAEAEAIEAEAVTNDESGSDDTGTAGDPLSTGDTGGDGAADSGS